MKDKIAELKKLMIGLDSFNKEINKSGGVGFGILRLEEMSALECILICIQNNIKFEFDNPPKKIKKRIHPIENPLDDIKSSELRCPFKYDFGFDFRAEREGYCLVCSKACPFIYERCELEYEENI